MECLKQSSVNVFDKIISADVVPIMLDVRFIRKNHGLHKTVDSDINKPILKKNTITDRSGTSLMKESWSGHILKNVLKLFRTHTLSIDLTQRAVSGRGYNLMKL